MQYKPEELCPMCSAPHHKRVISEPCSNCDFALTLPEKLSLSLEPASSLLPGHILLTQANQILSLNLWQQALQLIESKDIKSLAHALALPDQNFLVTDQAGNKLVILNSEGDIVWKAKLALKQPVMATAYAVDQALRYIVVDQGNARILELDHSGKHWRRYPGLKTLPEDKLLSPSDLQITENQHWLVSDPGLGQVVEINSKGAIIRRWGEAQGLCAPDMARRQKDGSIEVLELSQGRIVTLSARGDVLHELIYWPVSAELLAQTGLQNLEKPQAATVLQNGEWLLQGPDYLLYVAPKQQVLRRLAALPDEDQTRHLLKVGFQSQPAVDARTQKQQLALQVLQQNKLLAREPQEQLESLAKHLQTLRFDAGDWLLHPGEWGNAVFFIEYGLIEVCADEKDYPVIFELQAGETCGTQAVLALSDESLRPGLRVKEDCQLLMLERSEFKKVIVHFPKLFQLVRYLDREQQRQVKLFYERKTEAVQDQLRTRLNESQMRQFALFDGADETFREALAESVHAMAYLPDQTICQQGESGGTVYLLLEGSVGIQRKGEHATSLILSEGELFGEMSVIFDAPRSATLRTLDYCKLFMIEEDALRKLGREFPWFWERLVALAQQRKAANQEAWQQYQQEMGLDRPSLPIAELLIGARTAQFIAYAPSQAHDMVIGLHSSGELVWLWGQEAQAQIFHPSRVHTHEERLMVVDTGNDRVLELDIRSRQTLRKWSGPLKQPRSAVLTPEGLLLVADEGNQRLVVIDESGREVWQYGLPQEILKPVYAQITPDGHILFVDAGMHRVYELSLDGRTLWTHGRWRNAGIGLDQLNEPSWAHRFQDGRTLIADAGNQRLVWIYADKNVKTIPLHGFDPLFKPHHIEVLPNQDLLLMDPVQELILRLNPKGDMIWGARLIFPDQTLDFRPESLVSETEAESSADTPWDLEGIVADKSELYKTQQIKKRQTEIIRKHQVSNTHQIFWNELGIDIPDPVSRAQDFQGQALPELLPELDLVLEQVADQIESASEEHQIHALEYLAALENIDTGSTLNVNLADLETEQSSDKDDESDDDLDFLDSLIGS